METPTVQAVIAGVIGCMEHIHRENMATIEMCHIATSDGGLFGTESLKAMRHLLEGGQFLVDPGLSMLAWV